MSHCGIAPIEGRVFDEVIVKEGPGEGGRLIEDFCAVRLRLWKKV